MYNTPVFADELIKLSAIFVSIGTPQRYGVEYFKANMKKCSKCKELKPLNLFHKDKARKDGKYPFCKSCKCRIARKYHVDQKNKTCVKSQEARVKKKAYQKEYREKDENKIRGKITSKLYRLKPEVKTRIKEYKATPAAQFKNKARNLVHTAINNGTLKKSPCTICGTTKDVQMHHEDYLKPLDVIPLCIKHHNERHVEIKSQKEGN